MTARRTLQLLISASRKVNSKRRVNFQAHSAFQTSSPQPLRIRNQVTASAKKNAIWIPGHNGLHFFRRCPASRVLLDNHPHHHPGNKIESGGGGNGRRKRVAMPSPRAFSADLKLQLSQRSSPDQVKKEIQSCYELIQKLGRGAIYLGSSRVKDDHPHYIQAVELARDIARLLDCTTWTGAGPGLMDAAIKGALEAKKPVGGFKIAREAGEWSSSNFHPYLPSGSYITCRFFSARKHGLVDAAMRNAPSDMTAVVAFPGGIGTLDEAFEILALMQLERIGSELPVPFLLMNYDSFYSKLLEFFHECEKWGTVAEGEMAPLWKVCNGNGEALEYLANFYSIPQCRSNFGY